MTELDRLTCEETFRRLDDYLDRELSPGELRLVQEHLHLCAACAKEFRFEASLLQSVRSKLRQIAVPQALQARVLDLLGTELPRRDAPD
ncbi:MAG: anti-sigma factor family protein [Gemmatimonadaceae bacterium]